jgi:hypothetical protein
MSSHAHTVDVFFPFERTHPRLAIAIETAIEWVAAAIAGYRRRHARERLQRKVARDVAAARRAAYAMMGDDPRMACDLLAAADRHEAAALPVGTTTR